MPALTICLLMSSADILAHCLARSGFKLFVTKLKFLRDFFSLFYCGRSGDFVCGTVLQDKSLNWSFIHYQVAFD